MKNDCENIRFYGLMVLYNPDSNLFIENILKLIDVDVNMIVYDNSTKMSTLERNRLSIEKCTDKVIFLHNNAKNLGLSYAFNDAVERVKGFGEKNGLFIFDQDSIINLESITNLKRSFEQLIDQSNFGMVAGYPMRKDGKPYRIRPISDVDSYEEGLDSPLVRVYQVPSSYSLIPIRTFNIIGNFESDFFIDQIDNNFSMRCIQYGLDIYVDRSAKFVHDIGIGNVTWFGKFLFPYSSPDRHYYQTRNLILSYVRYNVPKQKLAKKLLLRCVIIFYIGLMKGAFFKRIYYMMKGINDGIKNKAGKIQ